MPLTRLLASAGFFLAGFAAAQPAIYETEPNDTPAEATRFAGPAVLIGSMADGDQDGFLWTVSDVAGRNLPGRSCAGIAASRIATRCVTSTRR